MKITALDHLVITTANLEKCLEFYVGILNMRHEVVNGHHSLHFGQQKFNIHCCKAEFLPAAKCPTYGSLDLCLLVQEPLEQVKAEIEAMGYPIEEGIVERHGALGAMHSIYLRDYDGNLVEISNYNK